MSYTPTVYVNDSAPDLDATNLNHAENGIQAAAAVADAAVPSPASIASGEVPVWNGAAWVRSSATKIASGMFAGIKNVDVDAAAAIAYSKVNLATSVAQSDMAAGNKITAGAMASGPPGSPSTGDIWIATAVDAAGMAWMFRYDSSQTTYKWVFVGGAPVVASVDAEQNTTSATYTALATAGPSITLARGGDYLIQVGGRGIAATQIETFFMSYDVGGTGAVDADAFYGRLLDSTANRGTQFAGSSPLRLKTGIAASAAIVAKYKSDGTGNVGWGARWMQVTPVRVI
jgi:hypothetical protein